MTASVVDVISRYSEITVLLVIQSAQKGLLLSTARFGAVRSALSLIGPMMWTWLGVDVVLKSIGTDYSRIVKTVFALAQVRLIRTHGFVQPKPARNDL